MRKRRRCPELWNYEVLRDLKARTAAAHGVDGEKQCEAGISVRCGSNADWALWRSVGASVRTDDLAAIPIRELVKRNRGVDWDAIDDVILGCANQAGEDNRNVARMALLLAGLPDAHSGNYHEPALRVWDGRGGDGGACDRMSTRQNS